jgi:hypothetical protein
MNMISPSECICLMCKYVPSVRRAYDAHILMNDALLPHVLMGDVVRFLVNELRLGRHGPNSDASRTLSILEMCAACGDLHTVNVIDVSFIENIAKYDDIVHILQHHLGPLLNLKLTKELDV